MNIIDAIKSGKPFKRPMVKSYLMVKDYYIARVEDFLEKIGEKHEQKQLK